MKNKFVVVINGEIRFRGQKGTLAVLRRFAAKHGGTVISLDSKRAV